jgi:hypothetical protein
MITPTTGGPLQIFNGNTGEIFIGNAGSSVYIGGHPRNSQTQFTVNGNTYVGGNSRISGTLSIGNVSQPAGYQLYVAQGILTEKVKVAVQGSTNWSDFVFNKDYKLNTLPEVEAYINKNKHLPEIPSAVEVVKDGIDLAQIDAKLLQKIEELTLYVIDLNKSVETLKAENKSLKNRMDKK